MGIKIKNWFLKFQLKKYIFYSNTILFRSEGLLLCFGPRKKFHASCGTLSQSNKAFLAKNCQIWVILAKSSPMKMKENLENDRNLAVFSQKRLIWLTQSAAGCMKFFSQSKTMQKPFWMKRTLFQWQMYFFQLEFQNSIFNFDAHFGFLQNSLKYS